jgi:hypothetical protein
VTGVSERKGKEVLRAILAKDVEWQTLFEELAEQVTKLSNARCLDAERITEVKTRITSHSSTVLPLREKVAEAAPPAPPPLPTTGGRGIRNPSPLPPSENNDEEGRQSHPPRCRWHDGPEYCEDNRPELKVREARQDVRRSDS